MPLLCAAAIFGFVSPVAIGPGQGGSRGPLTLRARIKKKLRLLRLAGPIVHRWLAERRLVRAGAAPGSIRCSGRVQLDLADGATVFAAGRGIVVGVALHGFATPLDRATCLALAPGARLSLGAGVRIGRGCSIRVGPGESLLIGEGTYLADGAIVQAERGGRIGSHCAIASGVKFVGGGNYVVSGTEPPGAWELGPGVWVGTDALILGRARVGAGSIVAAGAVVTRNLPGESLLAGSPAKVVKEGVSWARDEGRPL